MPPRTRRGAPARGGAAASAASAADTPKQETQLSQPAAAALADTPPAVSAPASTTTLSAGRPSATPAPSGSAAARSFALKPKVVRRADEERKALAEQEEKKFNDRAAEDARRRRASRGRGRGGRGGRGRGRGDFAGGRDGLVRRTVMADGPFSQVPGAAAGGGRGGIRGPGGFGGGGGFGSGGGRGAGAGGNFSTVSGNAEYDSRLNTDTFNGRAAAGDYGDDGDFKDDYGAAASSSAGGGDAGGSGPSSSKSGGGGGGGSSKKSQLLPMGIRREEHREPEVIVATTAELEAADAAAAAAAAAALSLEDSSDSDLYFDNTRGAAAATNLDDDDEVWSRAIKTHGSVKLVGADGEEIEVTDIDTLAKKRQELAEAAAARAGGESGSSAAIKREDGDEEMLSLDSVSAQPSSASRTVVAKKPKKAAPVLKKDPEDLAIDEGLQAMLHDLAMDPPQTSPDAQQPPTSLPGAEGSEEPQEQKPPPAREGRLFLFQFPPVLPSLKTFDPSKDGLNNGNGGSGSGAAGGIKREPGTDDDVVMLDGVAPAPIDLTENDGNGADKRNTPSDIGSGGFLGTLSIRKSGRAELSWGGMTYEMMPGTDVQFLTTAVLLEESDEKRKPGEGGGPALVGNAFGMGPVGGKYNLVPVFSEETEWTVDPSELVIEEEEEEEDEDEE